MAILDEWDMIQAMTMRQRQSAACPDVSMDVE
jgi:hypothetical protein